MSRTVQLHSMTCKLSHYTVQLQARHVHCPITDQIELLITNHVREFCSSFDLLVL